MSNDLIEYLKSPELVVSIQNYFGVEYVQQKSEQTILNGKYNRSNSDDSSTEGQKKSIVKIHSKFWYYLFIFGTALGDEL
jgi:sphingosine-1-phosphate phosphatase 1